MRFLADKVREGLLKTGHAERVTDAVRRVLSHTRIFGSGYSADDTVRDKVNAYHRHLHRPDEENKTNWRDLPEEDLAYFKRRHSELGSHPFPSRNRSSS